MRAGIGHGAGPEILDELEEFGFAEGIVGLHGVATDGLGDHVLAQAQRVDARAGGLEGIDKIEGEPAWIAGFDEGREGVEEEGAFAEFAEADPETVQDFEVTPDEVGVACGDFEGFGEEKSLGGSLGGFLEASEHLFEEDPFVGGVLVEEDQAAIGFEDDVESADDTDEAEGDGEEGSGALGRGDGRGGWRGGWRG